MLLRVVSVDGTSSLAVGDVWVYKTVAGRWASASNSVRDLLLLPERPRDAKGYRACITIKRKTPGEDKETSERNISPVQARWLSPSISRYLSPGLLYRESAGRKNPETPHRKEEQKDVTLQFPFRIGIFSRTPRPAAPLPAHTLTSPKPTQTPRLQLNYSRCG